jgi:hypothetical protein
MTLDRERWTQLAKANAEVIRGDIERLNAMVDAEGQPSYAEFWAQAREVSEKFKSFKPMEVEERESLWSSFRTLCEMTRTRQEDGRVKLRAQSRRLREELEATIEQASALLESAQSNQDLAPVQTLLNKALDAMKTAPKRPAVSSEESAPGPDAIEVPQLLREDREACWGRWLAVREGLKARRQQARGEAIEAFVAQANKLLERSEQDEPMEVQKLIRELQQELKGTRLTQTQRDRLRDVLRSAWSKCSERIGQAREERRKAHDEWVERMKQHLARWETTIIKNRRLLGRIQAEIDDLRDRSERSGDADQSAKLSGWIEEKKERHLAIEETTKTLEEKVASVRAKMGKKAPEPITLPEPEQDSAEIGSDGTLPARRSRALPFSGRERKSRSAQSERPQKQKDNPPPGLNLGDILAEKLGLTRSSDKAAG